MFNRRFLRVKILQALYAYFQSESQALNPALKELHLSIERTFDLYLYLLNLPLELKQQGELRLEEAQRKVVPSEEDRNPNRKFVDNRLISKINESKKLRTLSEQRSISWTSYQEEVSRFYKMMRESDLYKDYMSASDHTYKSDRAYMVDLYKDVLPTFDLFQHAFHESSIYWDEEDYDYASFLVSNNLRKLSDNKSVDEIVKPVYSNKEDKEFVEVLFKKTINMDSDIEERIIERTKNWDADRIALMDMITMKMALTEIIHFRQIPIKVSMNEYIDIAKSFSTPKSGKFINGILDKIVLELKEEKRIKKVGRGLME